MLVDQRNPPEGALTGRHAPAPGAAKRRRDMPNAKRRRGAKSARVWDQSRGVWVDSDSDSLEEVQPDDGDGSGPELAGAWARGVSGLAGLTSVG